MSGPVSTADVPVPAGTAGPSRDGRDIAVMGSRSGAVGALPVQRLLPQRARRTVGAWCFFDHGGPVEAPGGALGIGPHPHIGLQTVTWVLAGELVHRDGLGSEQPIRPGELNLMTAGHGVVHAEEHRSPGPLHVVQLWVAQPDATREGSPAFEHFGVLPQLDLGGGSATVLVGAIGGARSPARRDTDHVGAEIAVRSECVVPVDRRYEHVVVPLDAAMEVAGKPVTPDQAAYLAPERDEILLRTAAPGRAILLGGVPFEERVLMWWNYVARTREEITAAHHDWTARRPRFALPASVLDPIDAASPPWDRS